MSTFGDRLRNEREDRGLSLRAVAETLGVADERLRALERNDFRALPDNDAIVPCLRAYADCLQVDPELMIEDYLRERERCLSRLEQAVTSAAERQRQRQPTLPRWAVIGALALIALVGSWWMLSGESARLPEDAPAQPSAATEPLARRSSEPTAEREPALLPPAATSARLSVPEQGVGTRIERRRLVGRGERFRENTRVWYWTRVEGGRAGDRIEHVWLRDGIEAERTTLEVDGSPWRTYSAKTLHAGSAGSWVVEARDAEDRVLARQEFDCVR